MAVLDGHVYVLTEAEGYMSFDGIRVFDARTGVALGTLPPPVPSDNRSIDLEAAPGFLVVRPETAELVQRPVNAMVLAAG